MNLPGGPINKSRLSKLILLVNIELLLLVPNCVQQRYDSGTKTGDQYWAETALGPTELESLISQDSCYTNQHSFLSCVNSITQMAEKYTYSLKIGGSLKKIQREDLFDKVTEKQELTKWTQYYKNFQASAPNSRPLNFLHLWKKIDKYLVKKSERSAVIATGINGFLSIYRDPHTYIMPLALYEEVIATSDTKNSSAGFIAKRFEDILVVRKVYEGSPAARSGLKKGDRIVAMNGENVFDLLPSQIIDLVRMRNSQRLGLEVERINGTASVRKYLEIVKDEIIYPSVTGKILEGRDRLGLLTINKFSRNTCEQARAQVMMLKEQAARGIMIDLRDNPGGQVDEAACVLNLFLAQGTVLFETRYMDSAKPADRYVADQKPIYLGPLVVLINSGSASASEIVAGALREQKRAKLVGERSFGKGSFQDGRMWGPNSKIAVFETQGLYYFPSGWTPQLAGLEPDLHVDFYDSGKQREEELFLNPIIPLDNWSGPQTLSWLTEHECDLDMALAEQTANFEDPQLQKAQAFMSCGDRNGRHGSL
jgi:carboxyl-terminal processing protease